MRIAVLTLPFRTNYGQILQGYAMQTTLKRLGHEVTLLDDPYYAPNYYFIYPLMCAKRFIKKYIQGESHIEIFTPPHERIRMHTQKFIDTHLHLKRVYKWNPSLTQQYDAFIVGSDQVWRPQYFKTRFRPDIDIAFLSFTSNVPVKRIAYAASFGTDECEYTPEQLERCSKLAKAFDAISVREDSGVSLCGDFLKANAKHVIDPTLLLERNDYVALIPKGTPQSKGRLLTYILDENEQTQECIKRISVIKGIKPFQVKGKKESPDTPLAENIHPPVEQWLQGFHDAEFIITDSFHACVFSILFHKPFICIGNKDRGMSRFTSLLKIFHLENRLVSSLEDFTDTPINWNEVDKILASQRAEAMEFLTTALNSRKVGGCDER